MSFFKGSLFKFILFFSFPLATASIVDEDYESKQDVYDAILITLFPVFFIILFNVSGKTGRIKNVLLPLLDDLLYNTVTWVIPLIVSFAYGDLLSIKIFSILNMGLHVASAVAAIIRNKNIKKVIEDGSTSLGRIGFFLIFFPTIVIPTFWIVIITTRHPFDPINIVFLTLFGILLASPFIAFILLCLGLERSKRHFECIVFVIFLPGCFYLPNIVQTLFIVLKWPINFYFVKSCVFILVLSLTRNVSFFTEDKPAPDDFRATSTTFTQCCLRELVDKHLNGNENQKDETKESITDETKESVMAEMMELMMSEMKKTQKNESQKYETLKEEMEKSMAEMKKSMAEMKESIKCKNQDIMVQIDKPQ